MRSAAGQQRSRRSTTTTSSNAWPARSGSWTSPSFSTSCSYGSRSQQPTGYRSTKHRPQSSPPTGGHSITRSGQSATSGTPNGASTSASNFQMSRTAPSQTPDAAQRTDALHLRRHSRTLAQRAELSPGILRAMQRASAFAVRQAERVLEAFGSRELISPLSVDNPSLDEDD